MAKSQRSRLHQPEVRWRLSFCRGVMSKNWNPSANTMSRFYTRAMPKFLASPTLISAEHENIRNQKSFWILYSLEIISSTKHVSIKSQVGDCIPPKMKAEASILAGNEWKRPRWAGSKCPHAKKICWNTYLQNYVNILFPKKYWV